MPSTRLNCRDPPFFRTHTKLGRDHLHTATSASDSASSIVRKRMRSRVPGLDGVAHRPSATLEWWTPSATHISTSRVIIGLIGTSTVAILSGIDGLSVPPVGHPRTRRGENVSRNRWRVWQRRSASAHQRVFTSASRNCILVGLFSQTPSLFPDEQPVREV